jgi:nitroreductase
MTQEIREHRKADYPIQPLILNRWSPRAMTAESITDSELFSLFEAARWAPSSYNNQPWRIIYGKRGTKAFTALFDLLVAFNQGWAGNAAVLGVFIASKLFDYNNKPSITHAFDTGAAWENLCLEGSARGLVVHGMEGFDYQKARTNLEIPDDYEVLAMFAIGKKASRDTLPADLQKKEFPSSRKPVVDFAMEGKFISKKKSSKP